MKKTPIILLVVASLIFSTTVIVGEDTFEPVTDGESRDFTHGVLGEYATATWCGYCKYAHGALKNIWAGGWWDFYYVSLVDDKNVHADARISQLGVSGFPTVVFDGDYQRVVGAGSIPSAQAAYNSTIQTCGARTVPDIDAGLTVQWLGNAAMNIQVAITNYETTAYSGYLRVFVTEMVSTMGWFDTNGYPYTMAFLDYAYDQTININPNGGVWQSSMTWDGNNYNDGYGNDFGGITSDNVMVILAVYNSGNGYVDETVGTMPSTDTPPQISNVQATPTSQIPGGNVNITATVTDDTGVNTVSVNVTAPGGSTTSYPMTQIPATDTYYYEGPYTPLGTYDYHIYATDLGGNHATSATYQFVIEEFIPPTITDIGTTDHGGSNIEFSCVVQDGSGVANVSVIITDPLGVTVNHSMTAMGGDIFSYTGSFPLKGGYSYFVWAKDIAGNTETSGTMVMMRQTFYTGWNMVTAPMSLGWTAEDFGGNISGCTLVLKYDVVTHGFIAYAVGSGAGNFLLEEGMGYFVYVTAGSDFTYSGEQIASVSVPLAAEWNLIGWYHGYDTMAASLGENITGCTLVLMFDGQSKAFATCSVGTGVGDFVVEQGMGLFVFVTAASDWHGEG